MGANQQHDLGDDQTECQICDRYPLHRFLGLTPEGREPGAKTIWLSREQLVQRVLIEPLFEAFLRQIERAGLPGYRKRSKVRAQFEHIFGRPAARVAIC